MLLDFVVDPVLLETTISRFLKAQYSNNLYKNDEFRKETWKEFADLGLLGLPLSSIHGGSDGGPAEVMVMMEHLGKVLANEPYLSCVILGAGTVQRAGSSKQKDTILPQVTAGELLLAFANGERQSRYGLADVTTIARPSGSGWILTGEKTYVLHGDFADKFVVSARTSGERLDREGVSLFLVDSNASGLKRRKFVTQDNLTAAQLWLDGVTVEADVLLGTVGEGLAILESVMQAAIAARCAEAVGTMQTALDLTVDYLKTRQQFGVAISTFQSLQHRAAEMLVAVEQARSMAMFAARAMTMADPAERRRAISAAKVQIGRSARFVGQQAIQLHGAIGVTEEHKVGHCFRRLTAIELMFGDADYHLSALAADGGLVAWE